MDAFWTEAEELRKLTGSAYLRKLDEINRRPRTQWKPDPNRPLSVKLTHPSVRGISGSREADGTIGFRPVNGTLRRTLDAIAENRTRRYRRDVMEAAKRDAAEKRKERREAAEAAIVKEPLTALRDDVKAGRLPQADETVTENYKLDIGDRHYLTFTLEAAGYLVQLERLTLDYRSQRRVTEAVMRHAPKNGAANPASRPWKRTRRTTTAYLTASDLTRIQDEAAGDIQVVDEKRDGIVCVSYYRKRGYRVHAIVQRHLREAAAGQA